MALPAIREHAKMQQTLSVNSVAVSSPCAALPRAPSLSPSSSSDKSSVKSKKPKRVQQKNYNPSLHLKDEVTPIRRRFHSSDIILRGSGGLAKFKNLQENRWIKDRKTYKESGDNNNFSENSEEEYEPEPPLDSAELARLRRRTFSENFTKSSRVPSSFYQREPAFHAVEEFQELYRDDWEEECKSEDELVVDRMLRQLDEEMEDEVPLETGRQQDDYFDGSWVSQSSAMEWTPGNHSVESDGQNLEKLHNLQKLYQEGFITVTEYKDRRVQLVDELSEADQTVAKTSDLLSLDLPIVYREPPDFSLLRERDAIKHVFESEQCQWTSSMIKVKIDTSPFAKGGLRQVFHLQDLSVPPPALRVGADDENSVMSKCTSYVAKIAINPNENPDTYFRDVEMQAVAAKYAKLYNSYNPPRRVEFLEAWVLQLIPAGVDTGDVQVENLTLSGTICGVEPFIAGEYHKHNNNFGYVSELERNTPQTFSHFTYEASGQQILVVDIQGVGDHYTDPQIHTQRGKEFGKGNLALRGFERFLDSHRCNPICRYLKLPLINPKDEDFVVGEGSATVNPKGTIPAQTYMNQPHVLVDHADSVLCHYYGDSKAFKRHHAKKKRERKKREKHQLKGHHHLGVDQHDQAQDEGAKVADSDTVGIEQPSPAMHHADSVFVSALIDRQRSCTSIFCGGVPQCSVS